MSHQDADGPANRTDSRRLRHRDLARGVEDLQADLAAGEAADHVAEILVEVDLAQVFVQRTQIQAGDSLSPASSTPQAASGTTIS